jgi:hypothetical protein
MCQPPNANSPAPTAGADRQQEIERRHRGAGMHGLDHVGGAHRVEVEAEHHDDHDREHLDERESRLDSAAKLHAAVVDCREREDRRHRHQPRAGGVELHEVADVAREHRGNGRQDAAVHGPEHRPAPDEAERRRVNLLEVDVDAAGAREGRRQFGADQRADQRQQAGDRPGQHHQHRIGHERRQLRCLHEDRRADDRADDQGGGGWKPDGPLQSAPILPKNVAAVCQAGKPDLS